MRFKPLPVVLALTLAASFARADYTPIPLTADSFTADVVVENTAAPTIQNYVTATMDGGTNNNAWTLYEQGYCTNPNLATTGVPVHGSIFDAADLSGRQFQMAPDYTQNNALCIYSQLTGTLTLPSAAAFATISVLNAGGGGASTINYTIHHQGAADESGTLDVNDWFNTTATTVAWNINGRVYMDDGRLGNLSLTPSTPKLFYTDIFLADQVNPVTGIDFSSTSGNKAAIFGLSGTTDGATWAPIEVGGFNRDMIIEVGAPAPSATFTATTVTMDRGANNFANTFYERGYLGATTGLPHPNATITFGTHTYQMAPDYTANDCVFLSTEMAFSSASVSIPSSPVLTGISFLSSSGSAPAEGEPIGYVIHHGDGSAEYGSFNSFDWFNTTANSAYIANGRVTVENASALQNQNANPQVCRLFPADITFDNASPVTSIDFTFSGTAGRTAIFGISGQTASGGAFDPLTFNGYNADIIVEAGTPRPWTLFNATTVSMDGGTNNTGNTWFEQGYYSQFPASGLPPAGSTLTSSYLPDHQYVMPATYVGNNCIFVDAAHPTADLTPQTPAWYSGLSILSATANNNVTNQCIIQYSDGTSDTNNFVSVDWFNNNPYAFSSRGRLNLNIRTVNNDPGHTGTLNPRLYEAQFALKGAGDLGNQSYQITNIILTYLGAVNPNSGRMVALAVSGTTGAVAPVIRTQPAGFTTVEGSNVVVSVTLGGGTPPFTGSWQAGTNNVWTTVVNGGNISGADTTDLTFTSIGWTNTADYRFIVSGAGGSSTSAVAHVTVLSGLPDVTQPGDAIAILNGTTPGAEPVANAINDSTSKYLNFDPLDTAAPFVGPVGFIVTPSIGKTTVSLLRFYTANDADVRDPADYQLEGSNDGGLTWTVISSNTLALPSGRNAGGLAINPLVLNMQEVRFDNAVGYLSYKLSFQDVKNNTTANSMQIGEIEFLGTPTPTAPIIDVQPVANVTTFVGGSPTFFVVAHGYPTNLTYQWYLDTTAIPNANGPSYTFPGAQLTDSGRTFHCVIQNTTGSTTSGTATLQVIAPPTQPYPSIVMADNPIAFWRLDEGPDNGAGNNGVIAKDYMGGHNGQYSNTVLSVEGYNPTDDPDTAARFGDFGILDSYVGEIYGIDFASPTNTTVALSVEAWVQGATQPQTSDAGIVTKGTGGGGEQFNLDTGGGGHSFRFFVRNALGGTYLATSPVNPSDGKWHHLVGVCDEVNSNLTLYVDGIASGVAVAANNGILSTAHPVSIGSRRPNPNTDYTNQFAGMIDEVAIYNYALSSNQVLAHYFAANPGPLFSMQPTNVTSAEGATTTFYSMAYGPEPLSYQWYRSIDLGVTFDLMLGETSSNLVIASTPADYNGYQFQVVASNPYGSATSVVATLTVISGPPTVITDIPYQSVVYAGRTALFPVTVVGTVPFTYQWQRDSVNLSDGGRIIGAQSNVLAIVDARESDSGTYQLIINNPQGTGYSTLDSVLVQARPTFNTNGLGWSLNSNDINLPTFFDNVLTITDGNGSEARSTFYPWPLYIGAFTASFTYQDTTPGGGGADGVAFVLQNDPRGPAALGGTGGALGLSGITPSAALTFNIYSGAAGGVGYSFGINGANGAPYLSADPVNIAGGNPIDVSVVYDGGVLGLTLSDAMFGTTFTTSLPIDLPAILGADTAYVGISGATGGTTSTQTVSDFAFLSYPLLMAEPAEPDSVLLSWPSSIGGFKLQTRSDLSSGSWADASVSVNQVGDRYEAVVPTSGMAFYRLTLP